MGVSSMFMVGYQGPNGDNRLELGERDGVIIGHFEAAGKRHLAKSTHQHHAIAICY